jgi:hypothetical protein
MLHQVGFITSIVHTVLWPWKQTQKILFWIFWHHYAKCFPQLKILNVARNISAALVSLYSLDSVQWHLGGQMQKRNLQPEIYAFKLEYLLKSFHITSYTSCGSKGNGSCKFWTLVWGSIFNWFLPFSYIVMQTRERTCCKKYQNLTSLSTSF